MHTKHRFLNTLLKQSTDRTPVWMMRQAGRYLPEYRAARAQAGSFLDLCKNTELACEVTLQPLRRYPQLDAAILFSDILTIPEAMGLGLRFETGEGPIIDRPLTCRSQIQALRVPDVATKLDYVMNATSAIRSALDNQKPLIGFSGSPWTLACYMIQGRGSKDFHLAKSLLYSDPDSLHLLLNTLSDTIVDYLNAQIEAGAQAVQIFDTWGGLLSEAAYQDVSLHYMNQIISQLNLNHAAHRIPVILFTKGGGNWLEAMADSGADALGLDWSIDIAKAKARVGHKVVLQGNMDPLTLLGSNQVIQNAVHSILAPFKGQGGHVFNLGHGIVPQIDPDKVTVMLDAITQDHD